MAMENDLTVVATAAPVSGSAPLSDGPNHAVLTSLQDTIVALQTMLDASDACIYTKDAAGRYTYVNRAMRALLGGKPDLDLMADATGFPAPAVAARLRHDERRALEDGLVLEHEACDLALGGAAADDRIYRAVTQPLRDRHDQISGVGAIITDITAYRHADAALADNAVMTRALLDAIADQVAVLDAGGAITAVNAAWRHFRRDHDGDTVLPAVPLEVGANYLELFHCISGVAAPRSIVMCEGIQSVLQGVLPLYQVEYARQFAGEQRWFCMTVSPIDGGRSGAIVIHANITERKQADADRRIAATAFQSQEGIIITDAERVILQVNQAFTTITGYSSEDVVGKRPNLLKSGRHDAAFYAAMEDSIVNMGSWVGEVWNRRKNGEIYPQHLSVTAVRDQDGAVVNYVAALSDITVSKAATDEIASLAFYDPLTRLPNRRLLLDRLKHAVAGLARDGRVGAVMFIDLDNFKILNDTLGHHIGDLLLQQAAQRLLHCIREGDTVARLGGDEFVVLLESLGSNVAEAVAQTEAIAHKILATLHNSYMLNQHHCFSSASIGVTLFHDVEQTPNDLLKQADLAMYQAKTHGRNALRFFDQKMQDNVNARAGLEEALRIALNEEQFQLYYQIQVDNDGCPIGAEALIRWRKPGAALMTPDKFIHVAEESGLILLIGQWVLDAACAQLRLWQGDPRTRNLVLAVNVSAKQLRQTDFVAQVRATVQRHAIEPSRLKLELTESILLDHVEDTIAMMNELKNIGVKFSLDDFGTGYSSLQYLKRLPLAQLKIDQSFVRDLATDNSDRAIVHTIIAMARTLNLDVIAEGVETALQRQILCEKGCLHYQGYLYSRPVPLATFENLLSD